MIPDTTPEPELMVATDGVALVHVPPLTASDKETVPPKATEVLPVIAETTGAAFIVSTADTVALPQLFEEVYLIVSVPAETPVTTPEASIVAIDG